MIKLLKLFSMAKALIPFMLAKVETKPVGAETLGILDYQPPWITHEVILRIFGTDMDHNWVWNTLNVTGQLKSEVQNGEGGERDVINKPPVLHFRRNR